MIRDGGRGLADVAVLGVYWFLLAVALVFAGLMLWEVNRVRTRRPLQARVVERAVRVEVREVSGKRGKYNALFAVADLRLERLDTRAAVQETDEARLTKEELISHAFLARWEPGKVLDAVERAGGLDLNPSPKWGPAFAFFCGMAMFGTFAWMARPFALGGNTNGAGLKFLVLALFPIGAAGFGIWTKMEKERAEKAMQRVPVTGKGREMPLDAFLAELQGMGVQVAAEVPKFMDRDSVWFCEFPWQGRTVRSVSLYCQKREGEPCEARVNPEDSQDVKWGDEL